MVGRRWYLLDAVGLEDLEAEDVEHADELGPLQRVRGPLQRATVSRATALTAPRGGVIDALDQPVEELREDSLGEGVAVLLCLGHCQRLRRRSRKRRR